MERLKKLVREKEFDSLTDVLEDHWSNKYKLPPNHQLFLDRTVGDLLIEYLRDYKRKKEELESKLNSKLLPEERTATIEALAEIDRMLGYVESLASPKDPLAEYWERQMDMGEEPDLEMTLEDLYERQYKEDI